MSFHDLKMDASPNLHTQQKFSLFDFLLEKDKTKAKPTPIDLSKGRTP